MSRYLTYVYSRTRGKVLAAWERLWRNAQREEGQIERFLTMGIIILIVLAIAAALYAFRDQVVDVINRALHELQ